MVAILMQQQYARMRATILVVFCMVCILIPLFPLESASDSFILSTLINDDVNPPTIPGGVTATPIASSQINLAWTASTDDYQLSGYHVWRDGIQIATTTSLSYADVGLAPSTTYSYYITAYDFFFNESASSTVVATTTFAIPPSPPVATTTEESGSQTGTWFRPLRETLLSIEIIPQRDSVVIRYETTDHIRSILKWGRTDIYELGSLAEREFTRTHETTIVGLTPGTLYQFTIEGENSIRRSGVVYTGTFMTLPTEDIFPPGNVENLQAEIDGADVLLTWTNPKESDLQNIRVVRNPNFYPTDTADGWVVYEGLGSEVRDPEAFTDSERQYYTVFTYDALGNISSGAVVAINREGAIVSPPLDLEKNEISLQLSDIHFIQDGKRIVWEDSRIPIDGAKQLTVLIPYERLPEHLKSILVTIASSAAGDQTFTVLLRVNKDKTAYSGTLAPFGVGGVFPVTITLFDFKTSQIGYARGILDVTIDTRTEEPIYIENWILGTLKILSQSYVYWFLGLLLIFLLIARRLMHK